MDDTINLDLRDCKAQHAGNFDPDPEHIDQIRRRLTVLGEALVGYQVVENVDMTGFSDVINLCLDEVEALAEELGLKHRAAVTT